MDAKDRLRRYLEQRRELGESELVLDALPVEDVLSMLGAMRGNAAGAPARTPRTRPTPSVAPVQDGNEAPPIADAAQSPFAPPPVAPAPPTVRFAEGTSTDWRETLRKSGAKGDEPPPTSRTPAAAQGAVPRVSGAPSWLTALELPPGLEVTASTLGSGDELAALPTLDALVAHIRQCTRCTLHQSARNPVPGEGNPSADFLCVGEAPGANEDEQGRPFVGEAGQLLTKILGAIHLTRDDVYICNVLKHRPPGNRDPLPDEVAACQPYITRQLALVQPRVILALGRFAAQTLLQTTAAIGALRGKVHRYGDIPVIVTYHPAALLRNEAWKRPTWEDVKLARRILDASRAADSAESV